MAAIGTGATLRLDGAEHVPLLSLQLALPSTWHRERWAGTVAGQGDRHRDPVRGGIPALQVREPSLPQWEAMSCWGAPRHVLAGLLVLLLLHPLPSPACPAVCRCSAEEVDCSERGLRQVPQGLPANTSTLWLGYNFITVLGPRSFLTLPGLQLLSLSHNRLGMIHSRALLGLGALQELDLSSNHLTMLSPETFLPLTSLATLNLVSNKLGQLDPGVLDALPQLRAVLLRGNPWACSCDILPLWRWLSHNREKVQGECPEDHVPKPPPAPHWLVTPLVLRQDSARGYLLTVGLCS